MEALPRRPVPTRVWMDNFGECGSWLVVWRGVASGFPSHRPASSSCTLDRHCKGAWMEETSVFTVRNDVMGRRKAARRGVHTDIGICGRTLPLTIAITTANRAGRAPPAPASLLLLHTKRMEKARSIRITWTKGITQGTPKTHVNGTCLR
eukprot:scaffold2844_cov326-Pavlova_lutheri.AAC.6